MTVAGSKLNIERSMSDPPATLCMAPSIPQLLEYSLSPPRGPDCCVSTTNAWPIHIKCQLPARVISIGMGHADGWIPVPELSFIRNIPEEFMSPSIAAPWFMPAICRMSC